MLSKFAVQAFYQRSYKAVAANTQVGSTGEFQSHTAPHYQPRVLLN
ncbi:MAG: hypothetical protein WBL95_24435 [Microcoleus sp.]